MHEVSVTPLMELVNGEGESTEAFLHCFVYQFFPPMFVLGEAAVTRLNSEQLLVQSLPKLLLGRRLDCSLPPALPTSLPLFSSLALPAAVFSNVQVFLVQHRTAARLFLLARLNWR